MADPSRTASGGDGLDGLKRVGLPASAHQRPALAPRRQRRGPPAAPARLGRRLQLRVEAPDDVGVEVLDSIPEERLPLALGEAGNVRRSTIHETRISGGSHEQHPLPAPVTALRSSAVRSSTTTGVSAPTHRRPDHPDHVLAVLPRHPVGPVQHDEDEAARQETIDRVPDRRAQRHGQEKEPPLDAQHCERLTQNRVAVPHPSATPQNIQVMKLAAPSAMPRSKTIPASTCLLPPEPMVALHRVADNVGRESISVIAGQLAPHRPTLPLVASNPTVPYSFVTVSYQVSPQCRPHVRASHHRRWERPDGSSIHAKSRAENEAPSGSAPAWVNSRWIISGKSLRTSRVRF